MDEQRLERALRRGPPFATDYVPRPLALDEPASSRRDAGTGSLVLLVAVTALLLAGMLGGLAAIGSLRDDSPGPPREDAAVIPGLDGQAFMDAWETGVNADCSGPKETTGIHRAWTCGILGAGNRYDVGITLLGASPSAIHSIEVWVVMADGGPVDELHARSLFASVAEDAEFTGADPNAAVLWALENVRAQSGQLEISGVTYTLSGTAERRVLKIAPSGLGTLESRSTPPSVIPTPASVNPSASPGCFLTTDCPPSASPIDTSTWAPFTSARYAYTIAHPPTWAAIPATRAWTFEADHARSQRRMHEGSDQFAEVDPYSISWELDHNGYPIWLRAFAVDLPVGTPEDEWIADYYASRSDIAPGYCEYADAERRPILVDGQRGTMVVGDTDCEVSAFIFIEGRVHVFWLEAYDRPAQMPEWPTLKTALLEAFLRTVEFGP